MENAGSPADNENTEVRRLSPVLVISLMSAMQDCEACHGYHSCCLGGPVDSISEKCFYTVLTIYLFRSNYA